MTTVAKTSPVAPFGAGVYQFSLRGWFTRLAGSYRQAAEQEKTKRDLVRLTPHLLRDIGLSDNEIQDLRQPGAQFDPNDIARRRLG